MCATLRTYREHFVAPITRAPMSATLRTYSQRFVARIGVGATSATKCCLAVGATASLPSRGSKGLPAAYESLLAFFFLAACFFFLAAAAFFFLA
jgi:hypothetical protein